MSESSEQQKSKQKPKTKPRIHLLDELRGFAVFCMIFYHAFYSVGMFFGWEWGVTLVKFFEPAEPYFAGLFILISGISSNLSHSNIERGSKLFFISYAVTVISFFAVGNNAAIRFGILHMLSVCMMFYGIFDKLLQLVPMWIGFAVNLVLFACTFMVSKGYFGIPFIWTMKLPNEWYQTDFLYPLGFTYPSFSSGDYFPLMPWLFLFVAGCFFGRLAAKKKFPKFTYKKHVPFFAFFGRHALIIYLLHQPVIFGICTIVQKFL